MELVIAHERRPALSGYESDTITVTLALNISKEEYTAIHHLRYQRPLGTIRVPVRFLSYESLSPQLYELFSPGLRIHSFAESYAASFEEYCRSTYEPIL